MRTNEIMSKAVPKSRRKKSSATDAVSKYLEIDRWCREAISCGREFLYNPSLFHEEIHKAAVDFQLPYEGLCSHLRNTHVIHVKKTSHKLKAGAKRLAAEYSKGKSIVTLAKFYNYPPYLFSRILVETVTSGRLSKKNLTEAMRDPIRRLGNSSVLSPEYCDSERFLRPNPPQTIDEFSNTPVPQPDRGQVTRLAVEVMEAINTDPMYGPRHDKERNEIGIQYEIILEEQLRAKGIPFETEAELRERGTSRTPDILLSCPVGIKRRRKHDTKDEWAVICWIDSKALFGDVNTHQTSVLPQAESYVHRFGPGLVLYWFGHAPLDLLNDAHGDISIEGWQLPDELLLPTGELIS